MENESSEVYPEEHSALVKKVADHLPVIIITKNSMYVDKPVPVVNLPPVRFICGTTSQVRTVNMHGYWDP